MANNLHDAAAKQNAMLEALFEFEQSHMIDNIMVLDRISVIVARELQAAGIALKLPDVVMLPLQVSIENYQRYLTNLPIM